MFYHLNLYGKKSKKNCGTIFLDSLGQFFLFFTFLEHNSHKRGKKRKFLFIEIFDCNLFHWIPLVKTINLIPKFIKIGWKIRILNFLLIVVNCVHKNQFSHNFPSYLSAEENRKNLFWSICTYSCLKWSDIGKKVPNHFALLYM